MKSKIVLVLGVIIVTMVSAIMFIRSNNDHKECHTNISKTTNNDGTIVTTEEHICKERFNF